jgi:hypothetical protein
VVPRYSGRARRAAPPGRPLTAGASLLAWAPLRRRPFRPWLPVPLALVVCLCLVGGVRHAAAPPGPSLQDARDQLDQVVGNRVEATAVLGGQVPQGGLFGWSFNDVAAGVLKYPWGLELGAPRPLGTGGLTWTPVLLGSVGAAYFTNHFRNGPLDGNESTYTTYSLGAGGGPRIGLLPDLSVLPSLSLLYAYTENDFDAGTDRGRGVEQAVDGRLVNWHAHTLTFIPSLELRYRPTFGPVTLALTSTYSYFATIPIARSTDAYSFTSDSQVWSNRVEVDVVTPWAIAGWPLVVGGFFNRGELFGGLRDSLKTDHFYATGTRVALDPKGRLWKLTRIGLAGSYFWSDSFSGWTLGIDWAVVF